MSAQRAAVLSMAGQLQTIGGKDWRELGVSTTDVARLAAEFVLMYNEKIKPADQTNEQALRIHALEMAAGHADALVVAYAYLLFLRGGHDELLLKDGGFDPSDMDKIKEAIMSR